MKARPKWKKDAASKPPVRRSTAPAIKARSKDFNSSAHYQDRIMELEGTVACLRAQFNDLTAELADAGHARDYFAGLFHHTPAGYVVHNRSGQIFSGNQAASALLGLKSLQNRDASLTQFVVKADIPAWLEHLRRCTLSRQLGTVELNLLSGKSFSIPVRLLTRPAPAAPGQEPTSFHTLILDITGRRATEAALTQTQQDYRRLIDTIEGIVWEADAHTLDITFVSQYAERLLGYPRSEWNRPGFWQNRIYVEDRERVANQLARAVERRKDLRIDYRVMTAARGLLWLHDSITVAEQGGRLKLLGVAIDVTDQHHTQDQLRATQTTLELRVAERTAELRHTVGELEAFGYSISHDLRAPLRSMLGFAELALKVGGEELPPRIKEFLQRIVQGAHRADRLVQDLLSYSRVSRANIRLGPIDLDKMVQDILEQSVQFQPPHAQVQVQSPLLPVLGHDVSLNQVIVNLLSNATKFVAPGTVPQISLRTEPVAGEVRLWIEDNGIGIEPANLGRIFGIFERIHPHQLYEGTGIGLAIVRKGVERMDGRVGVESEPGKGSRFWIQLKGAQPA